jgi:hypothetical protein
MVFINALPLKIMGHFNFCSIQILIFLVIPEKILQSDSDAESSNYYKTLHCEERMT